MAAFNTKDNHKKKAGTKKAPSINAIHRPKDMTPEQWQKALRRQAAAK